MTEEQKIQHVPESARWYDKEGKVVLEITGKNGKQRAPTLRDARELILFSSMTSVQELLDKPGVRNNTLQVFLETAINTKRLKKESDKDFIRRISDLAKERLDIPRVMGKRLHAAIESALKGEKPIKSTDGEFEKVKNRAIKEIKEWLKKVGAKEVIVEQPFCNPHIGIAGTADIIVVTEKGKLLTPTRMIIADIKTSQNPPKKAYPEWLEQLEGYRMGLRISEESQRLNLVIDQKTGELSIYDYSEEDLFHASEIVRHLLEIWFRRKKYDPRIL